MLDALLTAARRGATVTVRLEGRPRIDAQRRANLDAAAALRRAGAHVRLADPQGTASVLHAKAVICDGTAFLDDRNWPRSGDQLVVRDGAPADVRALRAALLGKAPGARPAFWTTKASAERAEARLVRHTHARSVDVVTETFGPSADVYASLLHLVSRGVRCRLIVSSNAGNPRESQACDALERAGVEIRSAPSAEKFAIAGRAAWMGSANASACAKRGEIDWAVRTGSPAIAGALHARFEREWDRARALAPTG